jgi:hypothetical protein
MVVLELDYKLDCGLDYVHDCTLGERKDLNWITNWIANWIRLITDIHVFVLQGKG